MQPITKLRPTHRDNPAVRYADADIHLGVAIATALVGAYLTVHYGSQADEPDRELTIILTCIYGALSFGVLRWIRMGTMVLDRRFPWKDRPYSRAAFQSVICWLLPLLVTYGILSIAFTFSFINQPLIQLDHPAAILVVISVLLCSLAYLCAYLVTMLRRLHLKALLLLRWFRAMRRKRDAGVMEIKALKEDNEKKDVLLATKDAELLDLQIQVDACNRALALLKGEVQVEEEPQAPAPDAVEHQRYEIRTNGLIRHYPYEAIWGFTISGRQVTMHLLNGDSVITGSDSLDGEIRNTHGYFQKTARNELMARHMVETCVERTDGGLELTLKHRKGVRTLSKTMADKIRHWVPHIG